MNTLLLKVSCLFLFGFIFFQSFQAENFDANQFLSQEVNNPPQETVVVADPAPFHSALVADDETEGSHPKEALVQQ